MPTKSYSYKNDWDNIYKLSQGKPWMAGPVSPFLIEDFGDTDFQREHLEDRIADIGCGDGTFCEYLAGLGYQHITGIDASETIINQCKAGNPPVHYQVQDIINDDLGAGEYDIVVCWLVLHHILPEHVETFVERLFKICKIEGTLYLSFLLPDGDEADEIPSLFSDNHKIQRYLESDVIARFAKYFNISKSREEELVEQGHEGRLFRYQALKMTKKTFVSLYKSITAFKERTILPENDAYEKDTDEKTQTEDFITLLNRFSHATKTAGHLTVDEFRDLYNKLFRNVSRFLCKRILHDEQSKDVVILKMDTASRTIYTATQYTTEEKNGKKEHTPRPHSRFGANEKQSIKSRAYDYFLIYSDFVKDEKGGKGYTLHQHFVDYTQTPYICFSKDTVVGQLEALNIKDPDYKAFLDSLFSDASTDQGNGFIKYLSNHKPAGDLPPCRSFSCFNLGISGFESWGTLMIESQREESEIKGLFYDDAENETPLLRHIKSILFILKKIDYDFYDAWNERQIRTQATKAAIAQVMARNMSHNLGSHVFSNLIDADVCRKISDGQDSGRHDYERMSLLQDTSGIPQLAYFNRYLKSRMDYLSEVSFGVSDLVTTKMLLGDVLKDLDSVRLLLDHISGISGFSYCFKVRYNGQELTPAKDLGLAFPSDVLGCQAFYNIIENIIRNTAKHHNGSKSDNPVEFSIEVKDIPAEGIEEAEDLYCVEITNGLAEEDIDSLVKAQNRRINNPVLDPDNNLRHEALGLLEMKASAAFLRQINLVDIDSESYLAENHTDYHYSMGAKHLSLLKAFEAPDHSLGYRFYLQKPKDFLLVGSWKKVKDRDSLRRLGIQFLSWTNFKSSIRAGKAFPHRFLLFDGEERFMKPDYQTLVTLRQLQITNGEDKERIVEALNKHDIPGLLAFCWYHLDPESVREGINLDTTLAGSAGIRSNTVVFLHHGEEYETYRGRVRNKPEKAHDVWLENLSSRTMEKLPQFHEMSTGNCKTAADNYLQNIEYLDEIVFDIFEAYHNHIVIIDERVQRFADESYESISNSSDRICCRDLFDTTNVHIPKIPLDPKAFDEGSITRLQDEIDHEIPGAFLLIHYGVLERMYGGDTDVISNKLEEWATSARRVVVTSGRGAHSLTLPDSVCFINLSSMLYACVENRNKYLINNLIEQSRRKR